MSLTEFSEIEWVTEEAAEFAHYWRSLAPEGAIPRQSDFNPAAIPHLLPGIAIYEMRSENEITCRLMGTGLVENFGQDITDRNVLDIWAEDSREIAAAMMGKMLEKHCGLLARTMGHTESGAAMSSLSVGFPAYNADSVRNRLLFHTSNMEYSGSRNPREDKVLRIEVEYQTLIFLG